MAKSDRPSNPADTTLPLVKECVALRKRRRVTALVRVQTRTETQPVPVHAELRDEAVEIVRVPIGRLVEVAPAARTEGELTIIPVLEEVIVTEKKLRLKEEIHVKRTVRTRSVDDVVTIRTQRAEIERHEPASET